MIKKKLKRQVYFRARRYTHPSEQDKLFDTYLNGVKFAAVYSVYYRSTGEELPDLPSLDDVRSNLKDIEIKLRLPKHYSARSILSDLKQ